MSALFGCAFLIGMSKTGIQGVVMLSIPIMALAFGAKESTGVILPMLCFADIIAVVYYRRESTIINSPNKIHAPISILKLSRGTKLSTKIAAKNPKTAAGTSFNIYRHLASRL